VGEPPTGPEGEDKPVVPRPVGSLASSSSPRNPLTDLPMLVWDTLAVPSAYALVLLARLDAAESMVFRGRVWLFLLVALGVHLPWNVATGLFGRVWEHAGVAEARRISVAGLGALVTWGPVYALGYRPVPIALIASGAAVSILLIAVGRFARRLLRFERRDGTSGQMKVVVLGAGDAGARIIRDMLREPDARMQPIAILDDNERLHGRTLGDARIEGPLDALGTAVRTHGADVALLAIPSAGSGLVRRVAAAAEEAGVPLQVLPRLSQLVDDSVSIRDVRDLEIADLLGRQQVETDLHAVGEKLRGKRVLITGAGGSIGAEIARQAATFGPSLVVLVDHDETHLHDAAVQLGGRCEQVLADVRDRDHIVEIIRTHRPDVVYHAAAYKHVPVLERFPRPAASTNVLGTDSVLSAAADAGVEHLVFVSTDKAVNPSSVMGATKAVGEQLTLHRMPLGSHWCAVRFGNVVGSRGSVIPTFVRQIRSGGPVTVTDPRMTRFFMSIEEAVQLVMQAGALARGGEIFMLDMGEPVRIVDLAERMIRLSGRRPGVDVEIQFTGMRPGEKFDEQLRRPDEPLEPTIHPSIQRLQPHRVPPDELEAGLRRIADLVAARDDAVVGELFLLAFGGPSSVYLRAGEEDASRLRLRAWADTSEPRLRAGETDASLLAARSEDVVRPIDL
jgi:FlaA1/EpsC-like NDP-sugar epimerase